MRSLSSLVVIATLAACEGTTAPARVARTVANSRRASPAASRRGGANPPAVDSAPACPQGTFRTLSRYRAGRTLHFGPLCTDVYNGRFSAVMATGTADEASDLWVLFHDPRGDEVHRVRRFPVGAKVSFARIAQGWVYLLGRSNALEDMPDGAQLLAIFALPRPGDGGDPEVGLLSPLEAPLLRATDVADLDRRLAFPVPPRDPPPREAQRTIADIAQRGPNSLLDHLSPEGAPTLRAWQVGMFQETNYVSPQGDPTSPHLSRATGLLREVAQAMDCTTGDRCVARPQTPLTEGATPAQVFLRYEGQRVVVAALLAAAEPSREAPSREAPQPWGQEAVGQAEDRALAETLALDGAVQGEVVSAGRGDERALAFQVARTAGGAQTRLYVLRPGRAPRAYTDDSVGRVTLGSTELHLRDYERDGGLELVTIGRLQGDAPAVSIASVASPPTVAQQALTHRLDMQRAAFSDATMRELDAHLRGFRADPAAPETGCATLDRVAGGDARALVAATGGTLAVITYGEAHQPLRGEPRRVQRRELQQSGSALLGPFAGLRCADLRCDWRQSLCSVPGDEDRGVLWFADGGRRIAAVSLRTAP